jgi:hypothetical protein
MTTLGSQASSQPGARLSPGPGPGLGSQPLPWSRHDDAGSIVVGWLGRLVITLAILGVVAFEVLSIVVARVSIEDTGRTAADRALTTYTDSKDSYEAFLAADAYASDNGASLVKKSFSITQDGVSFDLKKTAPTLLLFRFDATAGWAEVRTTIYEEPIVEGGSMP